MTSNITPNTSLAASFVMNKRQEQGGLDWTIYDYNITHNAFVEVIMNGTTGEDGYIIRPIITAITANEHLLCL